MHKVFIASSLLFLSLSPLGFVGAGSARVVPGPGAIEDMVKEILRAVDAGDRDAVKATLVADEKVGKVLIYELDSHNQPVTATGLAEANAFIDGLFDTLAKQKVTVKSRLKGVIADCHSPELGYATFEFDHTFTAGGRSDTVAYRGTVLATYVKGDKPGWRFFHWHVSLAKAPEMIPAPQALPGSSAPEKKK